MGVPVPDVGVMGVFPVWLVVMVSWVSAYATVDTETRTVHCMSAEPHSSC